MSNLLPSNSWADRKSSELRAKLSREPTEDQKFIYIGCCIDLCGDSLDEMSEHKKEDWAQGQKAIDIMRTECVGFNEWAEVMGYVDDPEKGLTLANDLTLSFGKSLFHGMIPCYWVDHSRIEYIWIDSTHFRLNLSTGETITGRMSSKNANRANPPRPAATPEELIKYKRQADDLAYYRTGSLVKDVEFDLVVVFDTEITGLTPAEKAKNRAAAKGVPFEQYAQQEAAVAAMGLPLGDHEVLIDLAQVVCDKCGDTSNSELGLPCGRALGHNEEGDESLPPHCDGTYRTPSADTPSLKELAEVLNKLNNPECMMVIPIAVAVPSLNEWGCPSCGYHQGTISAGASGTVLWVCMDCKKICHGLFPGLEQSTISFGGGNFEGLALKAIFPRLSEHPRAGTPKRTEKRAQPISHNP